MENTTNVCNNAQQICLKFETTVSLLKELQQSNSQEENLLLLGSLRDVKSFLSQKERQKPKAIEDEDKALGILVDTLSSHLGVIALKRLVRDVNDIKENLECLRTRIDNVEGRTLSRRPYFVDKEDELSEGGPLDPTFWKRLTKRRLELLGDAEVAFEKREKSLRFRPRTSFGKTTQHNLAEPTIPTTPTSSKPALSSVAIDKRLSTRIAKLEEFLAEKQIRVSAERTSVVGSMLDTRETECEVHKTESALYRSEIERRPTKETINERDDFSFIKENDCEDLNVCSGCQMDQRAKDKFWGLASESADEEEYVRKILSMRKLSNDVITELNEDEANELFETLNIEKKRQGLKDTPKKKSRVLLSEFPSIVKVHDSGSSIAYVIKRRPTGRAGRGTWATPPYSPNWVVFETQCPQQRPRTVSFAEYNEGLNKRRRRSNSHTRRKLERISEAKKSLLERKQIFTRGN